MHPRWSVVGLLLIGLMALSLTASTCTRRQQLPAQIPPPGGVIPWSVPANLVYPKWQPKYPQNNRIYMSDDPVDTVAKFFLGALAGSSEEQVNGVRHVKVKTDELAVDIEAQGTKTQIVFYPTLGSPK